MVQTPWWASVPVWRHIAIWTTVIMTLVLIYLAWDTIKASSAGSARVPAYTVINQRIDLKYDEERRRLVPVVGNKEPLFGKELTAREARELIDHGKKTIQGRNCMNCHTLLGNGAYFAPDLTRSWLDPAWGTEQTREMLMLMFLKDPTNNARTYGTGRRMPNLHLTDEEARAVVAYLKWMSAIDTSGFPANFTPIKQGG
jgi:nitric oxide reductase subunit C